MPNYSSSWGQKTASITQRQIWKIPDLKRVVVKNMMRPQIMLSPPALKTKWWSELMCISMAIRFFLAWVLPIRLWCECPRHIKMSSFRKMWVLLGGWLFQCKQKDDSELTQTVGGRWVGCSWKQKERQQSCACLEYIARSRSNRSRVHELNRTPG